MDSSILNSTYQKDDETIANSLFIKLNNSAVWDISTIIFPVIATI